MFDTREMRKWRATLLTLQHWPELSWFFKPEALQRLAGGKRQRHHREKEHKQTSTPAGVPADSEALIRCDPYRDRANTGLAFRWCASRPPANCYHPYRDEITAKRPAPNRTYKSADLSLTQSAGFTLLEVILAIAVLAISLTAILEAMRNAYRNADAAAVESEALIYAESILAELATGIRPATAVQGAPLELGDERSGRDEQWQYSIAIEPTMQDEIVLARVLVESVRKDQDKAPKVEVAQWFLNPELVQSANGNSTGSNFSSGGSSSVTGSGQ